MQTGLLLLLKVSKRDNMTENKHGYKKEEEIEILLESKIRNM